MDHLPALLAYLRAHLGKPLTAEVAQDVALLSLPASQPIDLTAIAPVEHRAGVRFAAERMEDVVDEIRPLHEAHWLETEKYRHGLTLNPDYAAFIAHERAGRFLLFTARDLRDGRMVGNCAVYLTRSTHTGDLVCTEDTMFLLPEWRIGRLAIDFFKFGERAATQLGAREGRVSVKSEAVARLWRRIGYRDAGIQLSKILEPDHV